MFSVEDLLISHGYKLSKNPTNVYEDKSNGFPHEVADRRSCHRTLNGFLANSGADVISKKIATKHYLNENESSHAVKGRQLSSTYPKDLPGLASTHASETGFYDRPQLGWASRPKTDKDLAYWRRRGQDFSSLLGYTDKGDSKMKGMAELCTLYGRDKESPWETGGLENIRRTGLPEDWKFSGDYRWQSLRSESWNQPTKFGGLTSDANKDRLPQNIYSARQGDTIATSHVKGKSQSLPRVLSPESLKCVVDMPSLVTHKHSLSGTKLVSCPPSGLEASKHSDPSFALFLPLPKPKYGRPLKPPSYEHHQQTRGALETNTFQDDLQKDESVSPLTKVNEQMQDACIQDSSLEPPLYIPPPCYKSPAQHSMNPHLPAEVPDYDMCFNNGMQNPVERTVDRYQPPDNTFKTVREHWRDKQIPPDKKAHSQHMESHLSSVQYIPFDDPRIRHIRIAHPDGLEDNERVANSSRSYAFQGCPLELEYDNAFSDIADSLNSVVKSNQDTGSSAYGSRWLAETNVDQDRRALPLQREGYDASKDMNHKYPKGRVSARSPPTEPPYETVTKVKTFEPGSEMHSRSSKKKMNETIFCLVSIPVKSDLNLPDTDRNNNLTQGTDEKNGLDNSGVLQEQSLLSTSSTDLELQALTGSMANKNELQKQELWKPEFKQTNDLRFLQPAKHKEHQYFGSWPGDHNKDQQTQTSFTEEPQSPRLLHGLEPRGSNTLTLSQISSYGTSTMGPALTGVSASDRKCGQLINTVKDEGYLDRSSSALCPKVGISSPKGCQNLPCASSTTLSGQDWEIGSPSKEELSSPCRSKELFGQFLLKPVSRRPWDIISELESFNKELQEHEESSDDGVESDSKWDREEEEKAGKKERGTLSKDEPSHDHSPGIQSDAVMPVIPVFKKEKGKRKIETLNTPGSSSSRLASGDLDEGAGMQISLPVTKKDEVVEAVNGCLVAEPRKREVGGRIIRQVVSPHPGKRILPNNYDDENLSNPFNNIDFREVGHVKSYRDSAVDLEKMGGNAMPWNNIDLERGSAARLSLTHRNQGLSEPDLRSVGLDETQGPELDCYGKPIIFAIPPDESLQARAVRILGIDVPMESLVLKNKIPREEHSNFENNSQSSQLSAETDAVEPKAASYEGRRKCGWTESSFFVSERNISLGSVEAPNSALENLIVERHFEHRKGLNRQGENQTSHLESMVLPMAEKSVVSSGAEKKGRSPSKVIETLQGKLAVPPNHATMDRLVRMKEVHSVSRMRRLSIKNTDAGEDGDEETHQPKGPEEKGTEFSSARSELPRRLSHGSSVSKRIISLAENGLSDNRNEKKSGKDVFYSDAYDPTRVERV